MKILCVFGEHNYGDPKRGGGYEFSNFMPALRRLGHDIFFFESLNKAKYDNFADLNRRFLKRVDQINPDLIFCVLMSYELWIETLSIVKTATDAVIINWATDDSWKFDQFSRFMAPNFDLYTTTYPEAVEKSRRFGYKNVILTQWAANSDNLYEPIPAAECSWDVSFVGMAYGNRMKWVSALKDRGIHVNCFGHGWQNGVVPADTIPKIIRQSVISLNFGDSNWTLKGPRLHRSRQIKARVFEVPGYGGFLISENAHNLANFFKPDHEIVVFDNIEELASKIRYYLSHPEQRDKIARAGNAITRQRHTYVQRFEVLLQDVLALIERRSNRVGRIAVNQKIDYSIFDRLERRHQANINLKLLKQVLVVPCNLIWGRTRGPRAARRILFELSWRLCGKKTYTASGWPGRIFYRES